MTEEQRPTPPAERPDWWPEGQRWPPRPRARHRMAPAFLAVGCLLVFGAFFMLNLGLASLAWLMARALGAVEGPPGGLFLTTLVAFFLLLVGFSGFLAVVRKVRTAVAPFTDVMDALGRIAEGESGVRVESRGPREARRLVDAVNTMSARLGSAERERRQLLADVGHELRTPLSVIQGQLEGALDGVYPRDDAHLGAILEETRHMSRLVEDLRILSLAESGTLSVDRRPCALGEIVDDAVDAHTPAAGAAGVSISSALAADLPPVDVDPTRLREVLDNVLTNAIRYTPAGGTVAVTAAREDRHVRVRVTDTGRGIEAERLATVFDRFHRSPDSRGSGLGLAIARDLVRAHGGTIDAESDGPGRGTTIRFTLPVATEG